MARKLKNLLFVFVFCIYRRHHAQLFSFILFERFLDIGRFLERMSADYVQKLSSRRWKRRLSTDLWLKRVFLMITLSELVWHAWICKCSKIMYKKFMRFRKAQGFQKKRAKIFSLKNLLNWDSAYMHAN